MSKKKPKKNISGDIYIEGGVKQGAIGHGSSIQAEYLAGSDIIIGDRPAELADAFAKIYSAIDAKEFASDSDKQETVETVEIIKAENEKLENANEKTVRLSFNNLARMAPDIWEVIIDSFTSPIKSVSTVVKKIAAKANEERST